MNTPETAGFEVTVRFFPGAEKEASEFVAAARTTERQVEWVRYERIIRRVTEEKVLLLAAGVSE